MTVRHLSTIQFDVGEELVFSLRSSFRVHQGSDEAFPVRGVLVRGPALDAEPPLAQGMRQAGLPE